MERTTRLAEHLPPVPRLGVATRGNTRLEVDDVHYAVERGVRYLNWCGKPDGLSRAVAEVGKLRGELVVAAQLKARSAEEAEREMDRILKETRSERLELGTLYYVESDQEWREITKPGGAWDAFAKRRRQGQLGLLGVTSHQRALAASWAAERSPDGSPRLDMLMVRYNAAHTGAERDVFPAASRLGVPVVTFTALRWRDLLDPTPTDPPGFRLPTATECYRFCLGHPGVSVVLAAPNGRVQLEEDLAALDADSMLEESRERALREHGQRVRAFRREFP